ncbi:GntR family transcriptional regulator [Cytobacillus horneckiae]|uniref:GntR family transcriptional regulator n=1 Tax=Cytobacillus horneckiae TaxID=549687 RepID=UPI0039A379EE
MLDRSSSIPLYEQVGRLIKEKVRTNEWKPGRQLPSERELCEIFSVSRITIRQAIKLLETDGILQRTHGVGTFVTPKNTLEQPLEEIKSFQSMLEQQGVIGSTKVIASNQILSSVQISKVLNLELTDQVTNLQLLGYGDNQPIVYYNSFFPKHIGKKMEKAAKEAQAEQRAFSTLDLYRKDFDRKPTHMEQAFESHIADKNLASLLDVKEGWPIFHITSIMYADTTPLEYREAFYKGDQYRFYIKRKL